MDLSNPDWLTRQLMKVDPAIFYAFMSAGRAAFTVADFYLDLLFGYTLKEGNRTERWLSRSYDRSAQIVDVLGRGAFSILYNHQLHNFLYKHNR